MERHCLNCVWFNKEKKHCDYEFDTSRYNKPGFLDDDNNFVDDNNEIIEDVNVLEDFRCYKYYERPPKIINPMNLLEDYKNIIDKIKEYIKTELEERYDDLKFNDDETSLLCFNIGCWYFEIDITNNNFRIEYVNEIVRDNSDFDYLETFEEIYQYIDDVISEGY